jgi:hypothetical protein
MQHKLMSQNDEEQQWRKQLRAHDRRLLAAIAAVMISYFAALFAVCYFSLRPLCPFD